MKKHGFARSLVVGTSCYFRPRCSRRANPNHQTLVVIVEVDLNDQINTLHRLQDRELAQCRQANGKNSDRCRDLKKQHVLALRQMRDHRHAQL